VLPPALRQRISIEAGSTLGWERYAGSDGVTIGIDHFGRSAPGQELFRQYGLTPERIVEAANALLKGVRP